MDKNEKIAQRAVGTAPTEICSQCGHTFFTDDGFTQVMHNEIIRSLGSGGAEFIYTGSSYTCSKCKE